MIDVIRYLGYIVVPDYSTNTVNIFQNRDRHPLLGQPFRPPYCLLMA